jgi:hypothetical protein
MIMHDLETYISFIVLEAYFACLYYSPTLNYPLNHLVPGPPALTWVQSCAIISWTMQQISTIV